MVITFHFLATLTLSSDSRDINASVPQVSILGPLLFLIYVNDIVGSLETLPYLFADDTSLLCTIDPKNMNAAFDCVNRDLDRLAEWSEQWRVTFNAEKTVYMIVTNRVNVVYPNLYLHGRQLTRVHEHKHLGMVLHSSMKWGAHIDTVLNKAFSRLNSIRRISRVISRVVKESLYKALVLPVVEYGSILYDNCSFLLSQRLERLHRQAAVVVTGAFKNTSYVKLLTELGCENLESRRKLARLSLFKKMVISMISKGASKTDPNDRNKLLVPEYLFNMVPQSVGERVGYVLRIILWNFSSIRPLYHGAKVGLPLCGCYNVGPDAHTVNHFHFLLSHFCI